ncbi:MAG: DUF4252 domain-containing protein [Bacteroidales bacterium]|nr:DUF4252 domain-containing protein [Bacteroidales bacterium]
MKKLLLILLVALLPAFCFAQNSAVEKLFEKYGGKPGFTTVNINGSLLKFAASMSDEDEDLEVLNKINTIKILAQEDAQASNFYDEVMGELKRDSYEELMTVNSEDEDVIFLIKKSGERITEFLLVVGGDDENAIIYIGGDLRMKDIANLSKSINIDSTSLSHLEDLKDIK